MKNKLIIGICALLGTFLGAVISVFSNLPESYAPAFAASFGIGIGAFVNKYLKGKSDKKDT